MAKANALADPDVINALYDASRRGVEIKLNIRGICMLVPGVKDLSENVQVVSIIDLYLSSADWMPRNLEKRVELMFPVTDADLAGRIKDSLELFFRDNQKAHILHEDGIWTRRPSKKPKVRAQEDQYQRIQARVKIEQPENRQEFRVRRS